MELEIQNYLRSGKTLGNLKDEYSIKSVFDTEYPELVCLKYSQIDSPMRETIVQECRGIILNKDDNWNVVSRPYNKFFNYGEGHASFIDWSTAKVYDKLDGSLMTLYWYDNQWRVQSSGTPDAGGKVYNYDGSDITFRELFWKTWFKLGYKAPSKKMSGFCYMFELMTPLNKIVVQHTESKLVLHGCRAIDFDQYYDPQYAVNFSAVNWEVCKTFSLTNIEEILDSAKNIDPTSQEGYVVVDKDFNRVKIKSPAYVALSHTKDNMSARHMLEIVKASEGSEVLTYFPEFKELHDKLLKDYIDLQKLIQITIDEVTPLGDCWKEIGLKTKGLFYQGIIFQVLRNNVSVSTCLSNMPTRKLEQLLNIMRTKY